MAALSTGLFLFGVVGRFESIYAGHEGVPLRFSRETVSAIGPVFARVALIALGSGGTILAIGPSRSTRTLWTFQQLDVRNTLLNVIQALRRNRRPTLLTISPLKRRIGHQSALLFTL